MTKRCTLCKQEKHVALFNRNRGKADGRSDACRACDNIRVKSYRKKMGSGSTAGLPDTLRMTRSAIPKSSIDQFRIDTIRQIKAIKRKHGDAF